jgi:hypothetical protein
MGHPAMFGLEEFLKDLGCATRRGQQIEVYFVVSILKEDGRAPVATLRDMMRKPRNDNSSESSHIRTIARCWGIGIMSPYCHCPSVYIYLELFPVESKSPNLEAPQCKRI